MKNNQKYTPIRFSHLMSYAGVGAIIRGEEDILMVLSDIRYWTDKSGEITSTIIPYVTRVSMALGIDKELRMPPIGKDVGQGEIQGSYLPAVLFPTYVKCKTCALLHHNPWRKQEKRLRDTVLCEGCKTATLEQLTWCSVSNKGYLSEVPWHYICHQGSDGECRVDFEGSYLKLIRDANGKGKIFCKRCQSSNYYEKAKLKLMNAVQPWIYDNAPQLEEEDIVEILEVNSPGVYLPELVNALVIPPESRMSETTVIDRVYNNEKFRRELENIKLPLPKKKKIKELATEYRCTVDEVKSSLEEIKKGYPYLKENITTGDLIEDEYKAFLEPLENISDDEDFVTIHKTKALKELANTTLSLELKSIIGMIENHIIARRLREIQVFKGFYRGQQKEEDENLVAPDIVGESSWLPAIELFGEGVFFSIKEDILCKWEKLPAVKKRSDEIIKRYENSELKVHTKVELSPRFLLLHTLAHILIRELEASAGYPAASLKERIYSSKDKEMAGILVYTVVADIAGSLGGIVESAEPKSFLTLMDGVFKQAQWCSLDPVCTEHEGQGPSWLNRASCHACALIPEPSCDYGNVFLDRVFIKGSKSLGIPNFLEFVKETING